MTDNKKTCVIYKNDLKFNDIDLTMSEFNSENTREIYNNYKSKPKILLRIKDSEIENYEYLDLSKLELTDELLEKLFELKKIQTILKKIKFLDLSNNRLSKFPSINLYKNIMYLSISYNSIEENIDINNILELSCEYNKIKSIKSNSITKLSAANNQIDQIDIPNIKVLIINNNKINYIPSYTNLEYLECMENKIISIDNMYNLEELYISNNKLEILEYLPKIKIINCINNPIDKIKYFPNLNILMCSTIKVSSQYKISNISKIKKDYLIHFDN